MATFVRKKYVVAHVHVCKDIKPKVSKVNNPIPDSSRSKYHKIAFRIPDEYAFALIEKYGGGLQHALMKHVRETITPVKLDE